MAAKTPLKGIELIDCAKANAKVGAPEAARLCGYGSDIGTFQAALTQAGKDMGVDLDGLDDLITDQAIAKRTQGIEVAPDTLSDL